MCYEVTRDQEALVTNLNSPEKGRHQCGTVSLLATAIPKGAGQMAAIFLLNSCWLKAQIPRLGLYAAASYGNSVCVELTFPTSLIKPLLPGKEKLWVSNRVFPTGSRRSLGLSTLWKEPVMHPMPRETGHIRSSAPAPRTAGQDDFNTHLSGSSCCFL